MVRIASTFLIYLAVSDVLLLTAPSRQSCPSASRVVRAGPCRCVLLFFSSRPCPPAHQLFVFSGTASIPSFATHAFVGVAPGLEGPRAQPWRIGMHVILFLVFAFTNRALLIPGTQGAPAFTTHNSIVVIPALEWPSAGLRWVGTFVLLHLVFTRLLNNSFYFISGILTDQDSDIRPRRHTPRRLAFAGSGGGALSV